MKRTFGLLVAAAAIVAPAYASPAASFSRLPLRFEPNHGQTAAEVRFVSRGSGYTMFLTRTEAVLSLADRSAVRMRFGGNAAAIDGRDELPGRIHYFGRERTHANIPTYARVAYREVYSGIDLLFYGNERRLEYDFVVAAGADPRDIRLTFDGVEAMRIDRNGNLVLTTAGGEILQKAPIAYQDIRGERKPVRARYRLKNKGVEFAVGKYDRSKPLVIDPVLIYSTFLGGSGYELIQGIATDNLGYAYVTGHTDSLNFPNPTSAPHFGTETFVTKVDPNGQNFVYTTFIAESYGVAIAVDPNSRAHVTGSATWLFQPTPGAYQTTFGGAYDAFVARLDFNGLLDWATFLGGTEMENGYGIAVDSGGYVAVTGLTQSPNFPTLNAVQGTYADGQQDAFVTRLNSTGSAPIFSTFLGGTGFDAARGLAVDLWDNIYITGYTDSDVIPAAGTPTCQAVVALYNDVFVMKLHPTGVLMYAKCIGGIGDDQGHAIAVDRKGHAYVTGKTSSTDFPISNPVQATKTGEWFTYDAFVLKLTPSASGLVFSTFLGGRLDDYGSGIAVDYNGFGYISGATYSREFPTVNTLQAHAGASDSFLAKIMPLGGTLVYSTFLGGEDQEENPFWGTFWSAFVAVDLNYVAYVAGNTKSKEMPLVSPVQPNPAQDAHANPGGFDGWVARVQ